jgi:hypothetical protein
VRAIPPVGNRDHDLHQRDPSRGPHTLDQRWLFYQINVCQGDAMPTDLTVLWKWNMRLTLDALLKMGGLGEMLGDT